MDVFLKLEILNNAKGICIIILGILFLATSIFISISSISTIVKAKNWQRLPSLLCAFLILVMAFVQIKTGIHILS